MTIDRVVAKSKFGIGPFTEGERDISGQPLPVEGVRVI